MKKFFIIVVSAIVVVALAVGGFAFYKVSTPEYALAQTIMDVDSSGISGLKKHLTADALEKVESVEEWTDTPVVSSVLTMMTQESAISFLKSKMALIEWDVEDVLKGRNRANVAVGFNYKENIVGTIEITMIKENHAWKISGFNAPQFSKLSF